MTGTWPNTGLDIPLWSKHHHQRRHLELSCGPLCHSVAALVMVMMVAGVMVVVYINKLMLLLVATMLNYNLTMITFNLSLKWVSYRWWQAGRLLSTWLVGSLAGSDVAFRCWHFGHLLFINNSYKNNSNSYKQHHSICLDCLQWKLLFTFLFGFG